MKLKRLREVTSSVSAFTLLEVLAMLAVLALISTTLATSLAVTHPNLPGTRCLNNLRQLAVALTAYTTDNQDRFPPNRDGTGVGKSKADAAWAGGWLDYSGSTDNTNVALLVDHVRYPYGAYLGPYVKTPSVFKCPSDKSRVRRNGQYYPRPRTVSLNNYIGTQSRAWAGGSFPLNPKLGLIRSPVNIFTFLDEREDCINDGNFFTDPTERFLLVDYPGSYHDGAGSFAFADSHVELHKWTDRRTMPVLKTGQLLATNIKLTGDLDVDWLQAHAAEPR